MYYWSCYQPQVIDVALLGLQHVFLFTKCVYRLARTDIFGHCPSKVWLHNVLISQLHPNLIEFAKREFIKRFVSWYVIGAILFRDFMTDIIGGVFHGFVRGFSSVCSRWWELRMTLDSLTNVLFRRSLLIDSFDDDNLCRARVLCSSHAPSVIT